MPIRINLLAEQQAAEEMRRRDPVKRAIWMAGGLIALVLLWSLNLQLKLAGAKSELAGQNDRWKQMETEYLQVSNNLRHAVALRSRLQSLEKYVTNRFLWADVLNGLQFAEARGLEKVRVMKVEGAEAFTSQKQAIYLTNIIVPLPAKSWWKWSSAPFRTNVQSIVMERIGSITNKPELEPYLSELKTSVTISSNKLQVIAQAQVVKPETVTEKVTLTINARDYGSPPGQRVDDYYRAVMTAPFFKSLLNRTNCTVQPDAIQPTDDPGDFLNPRERFIPFTVEGRFPERIRSNE